MTLTRDQAINAREFHSGLCTKTVGPRGGVRISQEVWRRNGATKTWSTRPDEYMVPIKYGLYDYARVWHHDANRFHASEDCPLNSEGMKNGAAIWASGDRRTSWTRVYSKTHPDGMEERITIEEVRVLHPRTHKFQAMEFGPVVVSQRVALYNRKTMKPSPVCLISRPA